jgi:hypothetical protein
VIEDRAVTDQQDSLSNWNRVEKDFGRGCLWTTPWTESLRLHPWIESLRLHPWIESLRLQPWKESLRL